MIIDHVGQGILEGVPPDNAVENPLARAPVALINRQHFKQ